MSKPLPTEYLNEVRDRCNAATNGPWVSFIEGRDHLAGSSVIARGINSSEDDLYLSGGTVADQDFVAHARQDIPRLLDEIHTLRSLLGYDL